MISQFHGGNKQRWRGQWWLGMLLVFALGLAGCRQWGTQDDKLRRNDLSMPARQIRAEESPDKEKKPADPWMSPEAQRISRDLD
jgi:hypothetical protein